MAVKPRNYETLYLVRPDLSSEDLTKIQEKLSNSITSNEGEILKSEKWADRDLAYKIKDYSKGAYYILEYSTLPEGATQVEKHLTFHNTEVLRFITVNLADEHQPEKKVSRKPKSQNGGTQ